MKPQQFYSNGKLLLSGEYLVMDGALSLAVPVKFGQKMIIGRENSPGLHWKADEPAGTWLEVRMDLPSMEIRQATDMNAAKWLQSLLLAAREIQPNFLTITEPVAVETELNYNRLWGLGSSSTLIVNVANWAGIDPYQLLWSISHGSGYDIACASANQPILYRLMDGKPEIREAPFNPPFRDHIFFVYLGQKQDTAAGIKHYREKMKNLPLGMVETISQISQNMLTASSAQEFVELMCQHEQLISHMIDLPSLKSTRFKSFRGEVKSLGAWGGDFAMVYGNSEPELIKSELNSLGFQTFFTFDDLILQIPG